MCKIQLLSLMYTFTALSSLRVQGCIKQFCTGNGDRIEISTSRCRAGAMSHRASLAAQRANILWPQFHTIPSVVTPIQWVLCHYTHNCCSRVHYWNTFRARVSIFVMCKFVNNDITYYVHLWNTFFCVHLDIVGTCITRLWFGNRDNRGNRAFGCPIIAH